MLVQLNGRSDDGSLLMDMTLIPFATRLIDGALVGIDEVASGKACACACPSCGSPLIARQGQQKVWHFAHTARADEGSTTTLCEFSWAVSVRLMARQILPELAQLRLPPAEFPIFIDGLSRRPPVPTFTLDTPTAILLNQVTIDAIVEAVSVDAVAAIEGFPWVIYFTHGGRPVPEALSAPGATAACIAVDLHAFAAALQKPTVQTSYRQALSAFLSVDVSSKHWVHHPAIAQAREDARAARLSPPPLSARPQPKPWEHMMIERRRQRYPSLQVRGRSEDPPNAEASKQEEPSFFCLACEHRWTSSLKHPPCPHCGGRYTASPIR